MVDLQPLGALLGPGAPNPDLLCSVLKLNVQDNTKSIQIPYVFLSDVQKVLKLRRFLTLTFPWPRRSHCNYCHLLLRPRHDPSMGATLFNKTTHNGF